MNSTKQPSPFPERIEADLNSDNISFSDCDLDKYNEKIQPSFEECPFYRASDLLQQKTEAIPTLFDPLIPAKGLIAIVGASETGKSSLARQLAISVVSEKDFLGFKNNSKHKSAIVVSTEDDKDSIAYLLFRNKKSMQLENQDLFELKYLLSPDDLFEALEKSIKKGPVDAVIIDSPSDIFDDKDFNDSIQVRKFLNKFKDIGMKYDCLVVFVHHTGKRTEYQAPSKNNILGSQAFEAVMRLVLELRFDPRNDNIRHLCVVKSNYLPCSYKKESIVLEMTEDLVFHNTKKTFPISGAVSSLKAYAKKKPENYKDEIHAEFLIKTFSKNDSSFTQNRLNDMIQEEFDCSEKPARDFILFFVKKNWIKDISKASNKKEYVLNHPALDNPNNPDSQNPIR